MGGQMGHLKAYAYGGMKAEVSASHSENRSVRVE